MKAYWRASLIAALAAAGLMLGLRVLLFAVPAAPTIVLIYPSSAAFATRFRQKADLFASAFRDHGYSVTVMPAEVGCPVMRKQAVRTLTTTVAGEHPVVIGWSTGAWVAEVAALEGADIQSIVSIGGVQRFDGPCHPFVRQAFGPIGDDNESPAHRNLSHLCPILFVCAANDPIVPPSESKRMCNRAIAVGCAASFVSVSGRNHCPRTASEGAVYYRLITRWLSHGA